MSLRFRLTRAARLLPTLGQRPAWLLGLATAVLVAVVSFVYVQSLQHEDPFNIDGVAILGRLRRVEALMDSAILKSYVDFDATYDGVVEGQRGIKSLLDELDRRSAARPHGESRAFAAARRDVRTSLEEEDGLIERFKASNSVLRVSMSLLPRAAADAVPDDDDEPAAGAAHVHDTVEKLLLATLLHVRQPGAESGATISGLLVRLDRDRRSLTEARRAPLDIFRSHVEAVLREQSAVRARLADMEAMPTDRYLDAARNMLSAEASAATASSAASRRYLLAFSVVLAALFIGSAARLASSHAVIRRVNRDLKEANDTLERRVAERTRELLDANLVVENSTTILYRLGPAPTFPLVYISPNVAKFGIDPAVLIASTDWTRGLIDRDDVGWIVQEFQALADSDRSDGSIEYRARTGAGALRWVMNRFQAVRDAAGVLVGVEGVVVDITERKAADEELGLRLEREARHHQVLDAISEPVLVKGPQSRIVWANRAYRDFVGMGNEALLGQVDAPQSDPDLTRGYILDDARVAATGTSLDIPEEQVIRHDGVARTWHTVKSPLFDGDGAVVGTVGVSRDITDEKLARIALRDSEHFLDRTGRIGGVGGWQVDVATMVVQWTDQTCRLHDLPPGHRPTVEEGVRYYAPEARPVIGEAVQRAIATGEGFDIELPFITATGRAIWVRAIGEAQLEAGKVVRLIGAFQDITARRAMEAELRHGHEVLATVMENLPCGLSVFDGELRLVASNRQYRQLLDFPDALFDKPVTTLEDILRFNASRGDYGDVESEAAIRAFMDQARHPPVGYAFERIRPNGQPLEVRGGPLPGGGFVLTHTDISARRDADNKRLLSELRLRGAIDAVDEGFVLFDADDRLVYCNQNYRDAYRDRASEVIPGASFEHLHRLALEADIFEVPVADREAWVAERMAMHRAGDTTMVKRMHDGRVFRAIDRRTPDGHTVGFRADITELVHATDAAQAASLSKSRFLANMSHEIRTPMNAILGLLALLRRTALDERQAEYAARTESASRSLLGLLNDILDFSKVEAGKMALELRPFATDTLLGDLAVIASASVGAKPIRVLFDIDPRLPQRLVGDAMRLQQVLVNLLGNAIKFTDAGSVVLAVGLAARTSGSAQLEFTVRDTGIGIAAAQHEQIFGGFTQAESSTTRRFGGTGLGLTISQRLVFLMGGELALESAPGEGSTFHFAVELGAPECGAGDVVQAEGSSGAGDGSLRMLIVDAHDAACATLSRAARSLGWRVDAVPDAGAWLALAATLAHTGSGFDAVVIGAAGDIGSDADAGTALRLVAGSFQDRERLAQQGRAEGAGFDAFLVEPVTASSLRTALEGARRVRERGAMPGAVAPVVGSAAHGPGSRTQHGTGDARLAGLRLLLVEDNLDNQQVARDLLEDEGASVRIADDGRQALDTLARGPDGFDAVLMDIQMPGMDGFTAARRIRDELGLATLPIVAMTANASASDRDECLAAGMNDHIAKPFDIDMLVACLRRHAGRTGALDARAAPAPGPADAARSAADDAGIDLAGALARLGDKTEVYRRLLASFSDGLGHSAGRMRAEPDREATLRRLHALKGLAATLGATALSGSAAAEEALLAETVGQAGVDVSIERVCTAIDTARPGLAALLAAMTPAPRPGTPAPDAAAVRTRLDQIARHLRRADMAAIDAMDDLQERLGGVLAADLGALRDAINGLDFERALVLCEGLLDASAATA